MSGGEGQWERDYLSLKKNLCLPAEKKPDFFNLNDHKHDED